MRVPCGAISNTSPVYLSVSESSSADGPLSLNRRVFRRASSRSLFHRNRRSLIPVRKIYKTTFFRALLVYEDPIVITMAWHQEPAVNVKCKYNFYLEGAIQFIQTYSDELPPILSSLREGWFNTLTSSAVVVSIFMSGTSYDRITLAFPVASPPFFQASKASFSEQFKLPSASLTARSGLYCSLSSTSPSS